MTDVPALACDSSIGRKLMAVLLVLPMLAPVAAAQVAPAHVTPNAAPRSTPQSASPGQQSTPAPQPAPASPQPPEPTIWPAAEVAKELARCNQILRGLDVVARPVQQIKEHDCGAPAPMELISVGSAPQVSFTPPITVTCDMVASLHKWITRDLQPLARKHLGGEVVRLDTMSSYSCRTAYGRKNAKLSEHGRANAVDIRAFMTAKGANAEVLVDWGPTGRDIAAQVAAAKKLEAERATAAAKAAPAATGTTTATVRHVPPSSVATGSIANPDPVVTTLRPSISVTPRDGQGIGLALPGSPNTGLGLSTSPAPNRLGGPKAPDKTEAVSPKTDFLRAAHASACKIFGTVLGPEANAAHRNHFHVDMAERKIKVICE